MPGLLQLFLSPAWGMLLAFGFLELSYRPSFVGPQMKGLGNNSDGHNSDSILNFAAGGRPEKRKDEGMDKQGHPLPQKMQAN